MPVMIKQTFPSPLPSLLGFLGSDHSPHHIPTKEGSVRCVGMSVRPGPGSAAACRDACAGVDPHAPYIGVTLSQGQTSCCTSYRQPVLPRPMRRPGASRYHTCTRRLSFERMSQGQAQDSPCLLWGVMATPKLGCHEKVDR